MGEQASKVAIVTGASRGIGAVVAFLAGPNGGWINGQVLRANGGII
jgi:3-oxoacyl-[acyl-carrier protein] reductase